jgi:hypothetical protein
MRDNATKQTVSKTAHRFSHKNSIQDKDACMLDDKDHVKVISNSTIIIEPPKKRNSVQNEHS